MNIIDIFWPKTFRQETYECPLCKNISKIEVTDCGPRGFGFRITSDGTKICSVCYENWVKNHVPKLKKVRE